MRVSELSGAELDRWVAQIDPQCEGCTIEKAQDADGEHYVGKAGGMVCFFIVAGGWAREFRLMRGYEHATRYSPSKDWAQGGRIIERERIDLSFLGDDWQAFHNPHAQDQYALKPQEGPTPLVAAMRAYVGSKFGEEVADQCLSGAAPP